jgi:hypothetical protein
MTSLMIGTPHPILFGRSSRKNEMGESCSAYGGSGEVYTGFWCRNPKERDHLKDPGVGGRIILR